MLADEIDDPDIKCVARSSFAFPPCAVSISPLRHSRRDAAIQHPKRHPTHGPAEDSHVWAISNRPTDNNSMPMTGNQKKLATRELYAARVALWTQQILAYQTRQLMLKLIRPRMIDAKHVGDSAQVVEAGT
jgi:hypothetical protein